MLSVCMDAKIDQALPPEKEAGGTLYQVKPMTHARSVISSSAPRVFFWGGYATSLHVL